MPCRSSGSGSSSGSGWGWDLGPGEDYVLEESEAVVDVGGEVDGGYLAEIGAGLAEGLGRWRRRGGFLASRGVG